MGLVNLTPVDLNLVGETAELRIDSHFFSLLKPIQKITGSLHEAFPLSAPPFARIQNGVNLPETAYKTDEPNPGYRYVSVGAISQFALKLERTVPLRDPSEYVYRYDLESVACREGEVLITRSGTPGVAWPVSLEEKSDYHLIPSGFVMRVECRPSIMDSAYVAAILNHPVWRVWSASLAAGKRQRNLSHDHLAQILIPALPYGEQVDIGERYRLLLSEIERLLYEDLSIRADCDNLLRKHLTVQVNSLEISPFSFDTISVVDCAKSPILRMDSRFHRSEVRAVVEPLRSTACVSLGSLTSAGIIKGGQPKILPEDHETSMNRVIATVSIQAGTVIRELTKPTTQEEIDRAGFKRVQKGDLLVTMDGEGSIGKAGVFRDDYDAITDSHVGILRFPSSDIATALACLINSSVGQAQIELAISGATGQTQLSKGDLLNLLVPVEVVNGASSIAADYQEITRTYQPITAQVRRSVCVFSVNVSNALLASNTLTNTGKSTLATMSSVQQLANLLSSLKPELF